MSENILPLADRVLVKPIDAETKTASGIVLPDTADKEKPMRGIIVAAGEGKHIDGKKQSLQVKKGDKILFGKYAGTTIKLNEQDHLIMREEDILAIVE